jgi:DNA-binding response OmpR family regulator
MKARILVIEDNAVVRMTIQRILEKAGYQVHCVNDGALGVAAFATVAPDLVITDIVMPNKDGLETIKELRASAPACPIVAVSGGGRVGNMDVLRYAEEIGASKGLRKPFEPRDLIGVVEAALGRAA